MSNVRGRGSQTLRKNIGENGILYGMDAGAGRERIEKMTINGGIGMEKLYKNGKRILIEINTPFTNVNEANTPKVTLANVLFKIYCKIFGQPLYLSQQRKNDKKRQKPDGQGGYS